VADFPCGQVVVDVIILEWYGLEVFCHDVCPPEQFSGPAGCIRRNAGSQGQKRCAVCGGRVERPLTPEL
jgi:hypothetical protein